MKKTLFLILFALCFAALSVSAENLLMPDISKDPVPENPNAIDEIKIAGNFSIEAKEILDIISYGPGMEVSKYKTREDIKNLYKTGKFSDIALDFSKVNGKNILTYALTEKPKINKIYIKGNKDVGEGDIKAKLDDEKTGIKIKDDEYFDEFKLKRAIIEIRKLYKEKNFMDAAINYSLTDKKSEDGKTPVKVDVEITIEENKKIQVKTITIEGNSVFGKDKIKGIMKTKEEGWFQSGTFDEDIFIEDLKGILTVYSEEGYVKAKIFGYDFGQLSLNKNTIIKDNVKFDKDKGIIGIALSINEGKQYKIKKIKLDGEKIFTEDEIKSRFESKETKIFNKTQFENDLNTIRAMYSEKGYIFAQSKDAYNFNDETGEVDINLNIEEGTVAYVNKIKIRGNYVTKDKVILRELKVVEGEAFDSNKIRKSQENLYNLGFFDGIVLDTEQVDIDKLNIVFEVKERKTGTISLGAGYSSVEGLVGYVQLAQNNLFGEGKVFSADVQVGNQKQSWQLGYKDPWLFDTPTSLDTSIWNTNKQQGYNNQGYELDSYGFSLGGGRRLTDEHKVYLTYQYEKDKYLNVTDALKPYITKPESQVSSITPMYVFDTRDDVFDPGRGIYQNLSMQLAGGILGGDSNYIKALWDGRVFVPSFWKFVLGFHIKVGNAWGYNWQHYGDSNVPLTEKFYCGGTDTVRGYEERGLGPAEGGNFTIVTNIEYKLRLIDRVLSLVTFYDSGNSWKSVKDVDWQNPYLYPSAGAGVRFTIPGTVMMIRLDWGYALDPGKRVNGGKIHFNIGNIF